MLLNIFIYFIFVAIGLAWLVVCEDKAAAEHLSASFSCNRDFNHHMPHSHKYTFAISNRLSKDLDLQHNIGE